MDRKDDFERIVSSVIDEKNIFSISRGLLVEGDSLRILSKIPDHSVSLILTDPPYHSTKKKNIYGDNSFKEDDHYLEWLAKYANEWSRILRPNGSLFCFCSPSMAGKLETIFTNKFNILAHIVWTKPNDPGFDGWKQKMSKEALRQWYPHSERIIFAEPTSEGNLFKSYFGNLLRDYRIRAGLSQHLLTEMIGAYGKINHGGAVSNWEAGRNVPSQYQYDMIKKAILRTDKVVSMPEYQDVVRPFFMDKSSQFTDIWNFPNIRPYKGKHPAEKPIALLEHAISATTFPNDIVLDCFAGSGTTAVAALKNGRYSISLEIEKTWYERIKKVLKYIEYNEFQVFPDNYDLDSIKSYSIQEKLF